MARRDLASRLRAVDPGSLGGTRLGVGSSQPIVLGEAGTAVLVLEGHADVFAVRLRDGVPVGHRHALFRASAGEAVFGLPIAPAGEDGLSLALLVVGVAGTQVQTGVPLAGWSILPADHLAELLDHAVGALLGACPRRAPTAASAVLDDGIERELLSGEPAFGPDRQPLWAEAADGGDILLYGEAALACAALPVTSAAWVETAETRTVATFRTGRIVSDGRWTAVLRAFLDVFRNCLAGAVADREAESARRVAARQDAGRKALTASLRAMAATVDAAPPDETASATGLEALHAAFLAVARAMGVEGTGRRRRVSEIRGVDPVDALSKAYRLRTRRVMLRPDWWRRDVGPLLAFTGEERAPVAMLPDAAGRYEVYEPATGTRSRLTPERADALRSEAIALYRPLPAACRRLADLAAFILPDIRQDLRRVALLGLAGGFISALVPVALGVLIESVLPSADLGQHLQIVTGLVVAALGGASFQVVRSFALLRVEHRADQHLQAAVFDRILRLPAGFFRRFTAGDLTDRALGVQTIRQTLSGTTVQGLIGITFACFSLALLVYYNWRLSLAAGGLVLLAIAVTAFLGLRQLREERLRIAHQGQAEGFIVQLLTGVAKLRVAAAETRAYARWANLFTQQKQRFVRAQRYANMQDQFQAVFPVLAAAVVFVIATVLLREQATEMKLESLVAAADEPSDPSGAMSTGDFVAFNTAFGQFLAAMTILALSLTRALAVVPMFERLRPIVEAEPEVYETDKAVETLRGGIQISHVGFRYDPSGPLILDDLSLTIQPNEFVAIVGPSGSGKSTLVRLLLGFERCETGEVLYDGVPLSSLDITSVRQQVRVVLQNGRLTSGSVFTNIVGNSTLTMEDAWTAARLAGFEQDIEALPMGMHTVITEGVNTLSGGQRQRLMIARALVHRPSILLLDEPTSALDNRTQATVMDSLAHLHATRVVIAHRLSTIRAVDRILVLERGRLVQQGTFDELMATEGPFLELARRQLL